MPIAVISVIQITVCFLFQMPKQYPFEQIALNYPEDTYPVGRKVYKCVDKSKHYTI